MTAEGQQRFMKAFEDYLSTPAPQPTASLNP
jgi:hypothetical protein